MADNKTQATASSVDAFLETVADPVRRADAETVTALIARVTGAPATMWGPAIIGFGRYRYHYDSGREGEMCRIGLSPRKAALTLYGCASRAEMFDRLGKHTTGKGCLYIKRLADVDIAVLEDVIVGAWADMKARYPD